MNLDTLVKEIMITDLVTVFPDTLFDDVKMIFKQNNFHHIPVIDENENIVGIISKIDWLKNLQFVAKQTSGKTWNQKYYKGLTAKEIMTKNPTTLEVEDPISLAADIFIENKYHALPIVDEGRLVGIITSQDLITFAFYKAPVGNEI